jgi:DHA3 family macrolide efflux protein-like MFS transporter
MFFTNLGVGPLVIGIPLLVIGRMHGGADTVGQVWAVFGLAGLVAGLLAGRLRTEGKERRLIAAFTAAQVPGLVLLAFATNLVEVLVVALLIGAAGAVSLVAIFAIRQRRTDPVWFGRAFAVSMSLNMVGQPIGSGVTGPMFERSIALPLLLGAAVTLAAAAATLLTIPARGEVDVSPETGRPG